jgi:prolipoprotein diacylglyceryltransferase
VGLPASVPWAVVFTQVDALPRHPAMLYESVSYMLIFLFLFALYYKTNLRNTPGRLLGMAFVVSFVDRFILEYFKENQVPFEQFLPINMGQILCLPFIVIGLWLLFRKSELTNQKKS